MFSRTGKEVSPGLRDPTPFQPALLVSSLLPPTLPLFLLPLSVHEALVCPLGIHQEDFLLSRSFTSHSSQPPSPSTVLLPRLLAVCLERAPFPSLAGFPCWCWTPGGWGLSPSEPVSQHSPGDWSVRSHPAPGRSQADPGPARAPLAGEAAPGWAGMGPGAVGV